MTDNDSGVTRRSTLRTIAAAGLAAGGAGLFTGGAAALPDRHGPMRTGRFKVEVDGEAVPGWHSVTIPNGLARGHPVTIVDPEAARRLDPAPSAARRLDPAPSAARRLDPASVEPGTEIWGQTTVGSVEMERGVQPGDTRIVQWREQVRSRDADEGPEEVAVVLIDEEGEPRIRWTFEGAWIEDYDPPELDASADGDVATEAVALAYDKMVRTEM